MNLIFERTLLNLYSSPQELTEFLENRSAYIDSLNLSTEEKRAIQGIPQAELAAFQRQLHHKSFRAAQALLRTHNTIVLMSLHPSAPALVWGNSDSPTAVKLTAGSYQILHRLSRLKLPLTISNMISEYVQSPLSSLRDIAFLTRMAISNKFLTAQIKIPLVL